jgi:valyl-tRNA synthetase
MSKSLGNIIDPLEIIDKFGTDPCGFSLMLNASGALIYIFPTIHFSLAGILQ